MLKLIRNYINPIRLTVRVFTKHTLADYLQINSRIYDELLVPLVPVVRGVQGDLHLVVGVLQPHHVVVVPGTVQVQLVLEQNQFLMTSR
jgi:hypothetical protein